MLSDQKVVRSVFQAGRTQCWPNSILELVVSGKHINGSVMIAQGWLISMR